jgi:uncharacterized protein YrrD
MAICWNQAVEEVAMVKASDAIGRPVAERRTGKDMGRIKDLIVDPTGQEVTAIVLSYGLLRGPRVVLWSSVQAFGPDSVVINAPKSLIWASKEPDVRAVLAKKRPVKGLKLVTTRGHRLGRISDFAFDESTGDVTGYELMTRLFADRVEGRPFLPTPKWIELHKRSALVAPDCLGTVCANPDG